MSENEVVASILAKLEKEDRINDVLESPQTEFEKDTLISLDLSDIGLSDIPNGAFDELKTLKRLHLSFNEIESLNPNVFSKMVGLEFINLYRNKLVNLPDEIFESLDNLEWIDLRSNGLENVPKSIGTLSNLKYLFLQNNPLSAHPENNWSNDYHGARDVKKFLPDFQEAMGLDVTTKKPLTRQQIAERELKKREAAEK